MIDPDLRLRVGELVILNDMEQPCGKLVAVITAASEAGDLHQWKYINADPQLDSYNEQPGFIDMSPATRLEDFGVVIHAHNTEYWCEQRYESKATYKDGKPRAWQERGEPTKYTTRPELTDILWPF